MDIICFLRAVPALRRDREELLALLEALGSLDAAMGLVRYLDGIPEGHVEPVFTPDREVEIAGAYHPLLSRPVPNDLALRNRSCLITGSNMAGKTTFIKTIGINILLGQTLHFCLARRARLSRLQVQSSIWRSDHLEAGQSYYLAEVDRLREFVEVEPGSPPKVLLIDEIFRGTNTLERLAAATAVLWHLQQQHLVLVTTHDLELGDALAGRFDLYHFSEQVVEGTFGFDFKLRPGPVYTRNAIRLLELRGFPASITEEARRLANSSRSEMGNDVPQHVMDQMGNRRGGPAQPEGPGAPGEEGRRHDEEGPVRVQESQVEPVEMEGPPHQRGYPGENHDVGDLGGQQGGQPDDHEGFQNGAQKHHKP
ncbi:MutS-related protein [Mesoterricola sediminis]|uniref:DNA mismatch repair proteins mutS family domain-containing protein n=1 Tax=Mesoterricola sediminis TaxID=2927980 RepID=A0AA48KEM6_9BACT|nr:hypothetical protein [Mesoterricola sediminis]BDU77452.1 hypothetical protein METESE_24100 [Mesoterricola sediminis]